MENVQPKIWIQDVKGKRRAFDVNEDVGNKFLAKRFRGEPTFKRVSAPPTAATVEILNSTIASKDAELAAANARIAALEGKQTEKPAKVEK